MLEQQTVLTGIKPTGTPHLGNLVGAIKPVVDLSHQAKRSYIFIADLHALNSSRDSQQIKTNTLEIAATFHALGLNSDKTALFRQSDIPEIYALATLLGNVTAKGLMSRAHAYKAAVDKNLAKNADADAGINMGLFNYPVLMAADILLYRADVVPVGNDQKQHVEFARDIAGSFNHIYNRDVLTLPTPLIQQQARAVPGLDGRKMSKSYGNTIPIFAESKKLRQLVMKIITDSRLPGEPKDPDSSSIFQLYQNVATAAEIASLRAAFESGNIGYGDAKALLFAALERQLAGPRHLYRELMAAPEKLTELLESGAAVARGAAGRSLANVTEAMLGRAITLR